MAPNSPNFGLEKKLDTSGKNSVNKANIQFAQINSSIDGVLLNIQIISEKTARKENIVLLQNENWTCETEIQLIQKAYEIIGIIRPFGKKLRLNLEIEADDAESVLELIRKKLKKVIDISTQKLSRREIEVVGLLMQGLSSEEIGEKLFISFETVKSHRKNILEKTGAKNTVELINYYHQTFFDK